MFDFGKTQKVHLLELRLEEGRATLQAGNPLRALPPLRQALELAVELDDASVTAPTSLLLGQAEAAAGIREASWAHGAQAMAAFCSLGAAAPGPLLEQATELLRPWVLRRLWLDDSSVLSTWTVMACAFEARAVFSLERGDVHAARKAARAATATLRHARADERPAADAVSQRLLRLFADLAERSFAGQLARSAADGRQRSRGVDARAPSRPRPITMPRAIAPAMPEAPARVSPPPIIVSLD